jgi:hypothetical protein
MVQRRREQFSNDGNNDGNGTTTEGTVQRRREQFHDDGNNDGNGDGNDDGKGFLWVPKGFHGFLYLVR